MWRYFRGSLIFSIICLALAWIAGGWEALFIAIMLTVLEVSLSFDNAVINAKELEKMNHTWRRRFLTRGMIIAVFGMRIFFPLVIVAVVGEVSLRDALMIALREPDRYQALITASHISLAGFGGTFLFMVFLSFFLDEAKSIHRIRVIEKQLSRLGKLESIEIVIALCVILVITRLPGFPTGEVLSFITSSIFGLITYLIVGAISGFLQNQERREKAKAGLLAGGFGTFLYLEVLDASFSFDGVIGAFALTKNIIIIALGLGIGAMFVRSLTIMLVEKKTLSHYRYLEHGAFRAIGALALIMFFSTIHHVPELITGLISGVLIMLALGHSIYTHTHHAHE